MAKTQSTKDNYLQEAKRLIKRFQKDTGLKFKDDPSKIIEWLVSKKTSWKAPTWRLYKAAICYILKETNQLATHKKLLEIGCDGCIENNRITQSSSKKDKHLSVADEALLKDHFVKRKNAKWAIPTCFYMKATLLTGLRPKEWLTAKLAIMHYEGKDIYVLAVFNAKNTNGRSHGLKRHLLLGNLTNLDIKIIKVHINNINNHIKDGASFKDYQEGCRQAMKRATKEIFPKRKKKPTLYTCRHQFITNLKNAGYTLTNIAAIVGHATDETATVHYGHRSHKKGGGIKPGSSLPIAYPPEAAKVREVHEQKSKNAPHNQNKKGPRL